MNEGDIIGWDRTRRNRGFIGHLGENSRLGESDIDVYVAITVLGCHTPQPPSHLIRIQVMW